MKKPKNLFEAIMQLEKSKDAQIPSQEEIERKADELAAMVDIEEIKRRISEAMKKE